MKAKSNFFAIAAGRQGFMITLMAKRITIASGLLLAALFLALSGAFYFENREPVWKGRKLSDWTEKQSTGFAANLTYYLDWPPRWEGADEAIKQIGTNGIPTLLKMVRATEGDFERRRLLKFVSKQPFVRIPRKPAYEFNQEAEYAFKLLGTNGASAVPGLMQIYREARSKDSQRAAGLSLAWMGRAAEVAVPMLIKDFAHPNMELRGCAVHAVGSIGGDPAVLIPALCSVLKDQERQILWHAAYRLGNMGRNAVEAVPHLLDALAAEKLRGDLRFTKHLELALWMIAPEESPKSIVFESAKPMVLEGITVANLEIEVNGKRKTMIFTGTAVPVMRKIWHPDPRVGVRIFLVENDGKEEFLGEIEVEGSLASELDDTQLVFGMTNEKIFAGALDTDGYQLLVRGVKPAD